jgi:ferredoxin
LGAANHQSGICEELCPTGAIELPYEIVSLTQLKGNRND